MIICPTCNTQNEAGSVFCDQCGASLAAAGNGGAPAFAAAASANTCPVCGAAAISGDAFCNECGAALNASPAQAAALPASAVGTSFTTAAAIPTAARTGQAQLVLADGQSVVLAGKTSYLIGREDPVSGIFPEVDTTRSDGDTAGVSRRHAEIIQQNGQWFLADLNSTNGSFVNNQRVTPHTRQPLQAGDQIRLGKWVGTFQVN